MDSPATYALFLDKGRLWVSRVEEYAKKQARLLLPGGREVWVSRALLPHLWQAAAGEPPLPPEEAARRLAETPLPMGLEPLHRGLPPGQPVDFARLVCLAWPGGPANPWQQAALYLALFNGERWFRRSGGGFVARSPVEMAQRAKRDEEAQQDAAWGLRVSGWLAQLKSGGWPPPADGGPTTAERADLVARLEELAAFGRRSPHWKRLAHLLGLHPHHQADNGVALMELLQAAGCWRGWGRIWLLWAGVAEGFAPEVLAAAGPLAQEPPSLEGREDLRHLESYSLDSPNTQDFDDAYALPPPPEAEAGNGLAVAVHIAQPPLSLAPGHPVFDEAARRMASVYTPEGIHPMLDESLSNGRFSLVAGQDREALTFKFWLHPQGARLLAITPSLVRVKANLDYTQGEALMAQHPQGWGRLVALCQGLAAQRGQRGANISDRPELMINKADPAAIQMVSINRTGPIHRTVEELAILVNQAAGRYCRDHNLPAIYRVQPPPKGAGGGQGFTPAARFSVRGGVHAGLACDRYVQVTSPIRRFPDLVMQRQVAAHLAGLPLPYADLGLLEGWARQAEVRLATYGEVEKRMDDAYKRLYLAQNPGLVLTGQVRQAVEGPGHNHGHGQVFLEEVLLAADGVFPVGVGKGRRGRFALDGVDTNRHTVRVRWLEPAD